MYSETDFRPEIQYVIYWQDKRVSTIATLQPELPLDRNYHTPSCHSNQPTPNDATLQPELPLDHNYHHNTSVASFSLRLSGVSESRESWESQSLRTMNCTIAHNLVSPDPFRWKAVAAGEFLAEVWVMLHQLQKYVFLPKKETNIMFDHRILRPWPHKLLQQLLIAVTPGENHHMVNTQTWTAVERRERLVRFKEKQNVIEIKLFIDRWGSPGKSLVPV